MNKRTLSATNFFGVGKFPALGNADVSGLPIEFVTPHVSPILALMSHAEIFWRKSRIDAT